MAATADRRRAVIQRMREARGFSARGSAAEEAEQRALFRCEAAFSDWIISRSEVMRQQRNRFERESNSAWWWDAFAQWLPADAKSAVCAELQTWREALVKEFEAAGEISLARSQRDAIFRAVADFVQQAQWRIWSVDAVPDHKARTDFKEACDNFEERIAKVGRKLRELAAEIESLWAREHDPLWRDGLSRLQWRLEESLLCQALEAREELDHVERASEKTKYVLDDLGQRLQKGIFPDQPLGRRLVEHLLRVYEKASGEALEAANAPFVRFLSSIYGAMPEHLQKFASQSSEGFVQDARRLISERKATMKFKAYCYERRLCALPASIETLRDYIQHLIINGAKAQTIYIHRAAIDSTHRMQGLSVDWRPLRDLMKRVHRPKKLQRVRPSKGAGYTTSRS